MHVELILFNITFSLCSVTPKSTPVVAMVEGHTRSRDGWACRGRGRRAGGAVSFMLLDPTAHNLAPNLFVSTYNPVLVQPSL